MSHSPKSYRQAQQDAAKRLFRRPHTSPELEAALLLCHLLGVTRSHLMAWPEKQLTPGQLRDYKTLIRRRLAGEPIAHITGEREFWSLSLHVTPDTLIPRPETELLVERALMHLTDTTAPCIADLGTGSGAIALALASELPNALIHATDRSSAALAVASKNAERLRFKGIRFYLGDWCQALPTEEEYDLILSNPPYIQADDPHLNQGDLRYESVTALISGPDGLQDIRSIAAQAPERLKPGGWLLLEHGSEQAPAVRRILQDRGFIETASLNDLAGHPRVTEGRLAPARHLADDFTTA